MDNQASTTQPADLTGRTLADFRILRRLGAGGMGQVYLAEQLSLHRKVALKVLRPELVASSAQAMERFQVEAWAVAKATHANIVQVHAIGQADGYWYMALEYVEGRNLKEYLARKGPPDVLLALSIMRQVAAALARAGELGIIHRDIKPENILLTRKGEVKVADFGLCPAHCLVEGKPLNLTESGTTMGTPLYMSPEQIEGKALDPRTDLYSFGVTCYHMLVGQPPFQGQAALEVALKHLREEPAPLARMRPDLPEGLCAIVGKLMAKDRDQRYATARDLLKEIVRLRESLGGQPNVVPPLSVTLDAPAATRVDVVPLPEPRRSWRPVLIGASLVAALSLGIGWGWLRRQAAGAAHAAAVVATEQPPQAHIQEDEARRVLAEQFLRDPARAPDFALGLAECMKLGLYYLKHDRLDEAEAWFQLLAQKQPFACRSLGHLGKAIVLALRSQVEESHRAFEDWAALVHQHENLAKRRDGRAGLPMDIRELRFWLIKALEYNRANGVHKEAPVRVRYLAYGKV
jgi:serine/threonine-protein kinase